MTKISKEVKIVSWVTALQRFGFGFVEALIPVFLYKFSNSFSEAGILASVYQISFILVTPIVGIIANKISTRKMLLIGLCFYPFISISYFFSGVFLMAIFIVIARILNGIGISFISIGRQNCIYKYTSNKNISQALGYFESVTNFARIAPMFLGLFLIGFIPLHYLFLFIGVFSIMALIVGYYKLPEEKDENIKDLISIKKIKNSYKEIYKDFLNYDNKLRNILIIGLLINLINTAFLFFIPIEAYENGANYKMIIIMTIVWTIPELIGVFIGKISDKFPLKSYVIGFVLLIIVLLLSAYIESYYFKLIIVLLFSILIKIIDYTKSKYIHSLSEKDKLGSINGINEQFSNFGVMLGPLLIGMIIQVGGFNSGIVFLVFISLISLFIGTRNFYSYKLEEESN